jgi:hypothetical protein
MSDESYAQSKIVVSAIAKTFGLGIILDKIKSAVGNGQGYTFDGSNRANEGQKEQVSNISDSVHGRFVALPQDIINTLTNNNPQIQQEIQVLDQLWEQKIQAIEEAIARKILEERKKEEEELLKRHRDKTIETAGEINKNVEDEKKENADSLKYRIFASLIFSGILDITNILECVINIFGINESFSEAVGEVVANNKVMSFIGDINKTFGIDKLVELVSRAPILNDVNQTALEIANTDAFQTFSPLAKEILTGDLTEYGFRVLSFVHVALGESGLRENHEKRSQDNDDKIRELEELIREEAKPNAIRIASRAIDIETRFRLDEIYIRSYLKAVCEDGQEINEGDKINLGHFIIRDGDKSKCETLLDKINEAKSESDRNQKLVKIQEILELVVKDEARNNMDVLNSFREVARESFYRLEVPNEEIQKRREKYLKEDVLKDLEKVGNEYKKEAAQEVLKEEMKTQYAGNDANINDKNKQISNLSTPDEFANFIKNEFQSNRKFDEIVTKIAISVKKDEIAQTVVRSPFHRVCPKAVISGGDAGGRNVTHVASGQSVGKGGEPAALAAGAAGAAGPAGASVSL